MPTLAKKHITYYTGSLVITFDIKRQSRLWSCPVGHRLTRGGELGVQSWKQVPFIKFYSPQIQQQRGTEKTHVEWKSEQVFSFKFFQCLLNFCKIDFQPFHVDTWFSMVWSSGHLPRALCSLCLCHRRLRTAGGSPPAPSPVHLC